MESKTTKGHWLYGDHREIKIKAETDCRMCLHREVCDRDMEKRCGNWLFGRSDAHHGCDQCTNHYARFDKDSVPCFICDKFLLDEKITEDLESSSWYPKQVKRSELG